MDGMLSQEEINALLGEMSTDDGADSPAEAGADGELLSEVERDAVGEISNISMGTAATTLSTLVNDVVNITTPKVSHATIEEVANSYERPCVYIHISYVEGLDGSNILILKDEDVKIITSLMMGGDGSTIDEELSEMHLSAIAEAMNQMMGSAATSLSSMLNKKVDISPPIANQYDVNADVLSDEMKKLSGEQLVMVSFKMEIGSLVNSEIMQMFPISFAREMYECYKEVIASDMAGGGDDDGFHDIGPSTPVTPQPAPAPTPMPSAPAPDMNAGMAMPGYQQPPNVQPVAFQNFAPVSAVPQPQNYDLIMDVPLEVTVELGRANKSIKEILDFSPGTIIELNKLAGEPVDVLVNGKLVAKGEVVVIEESFGIRITELVKGL